MYDLHSCADMKQKVSANRDNLNMHFFLESQNGGFPVSNYNDPVITLFQWGEILDLHDDHIILIDQSFSYIGLHAFDTLSV